MAKDYYKILGIEKNASKDEVKKAFHKLAHKYHPDKKGGDEAKFKEINEAYQILSDDSKRSQYDTYGQTFAGGAGGFNPNDFGFDFSGFGGNAGGVEFDLGDLFGNIFNGGGRGQKRGRDISVDIQISFKEAVFGTERKILINKVGVCDICGGSGAEPGSAKHKCTTCAGRGEVKETRRSFLGTFTTARECSTCHGRGEVPDRVCSRCDGLGALKKAEEVHIIIPAGIEDGEMIRLSGKGELVPGGVAGDLYIKVHVEKHPIFRREGANLLMDLNIKLSDALLGADYQIETLENNLTIKIPEGISSGEIMRVKNAGIPARSGKRGDLYVKIIVKTPQKLSKKAKQLIQDLKKEGI